MCWALYLASDRELPIIPWDEENPSFHAVELTREVDKTVVRHFSRPHIRYVGSPQRCGCSFLKKDERSLRDLGTMRRYAKAALEDSGEIEALLCWEGAQKKPLKGTRRISLGEFCFDGVSVLPRVLTIIASSQQ